VVVSHYARRELILRDLEQEARAPRRGLWADPAPVPPWEWWKERRRGRAPIALRQSGQPLWR